LAVFEDHQVFSQDPCPDWCSIGLVHFLAQAHRLPVAAHELAHGRIALDSAEQLVVFFSHHVVNLNANARTWFGRFPRQSGGCKIG
jgi:hypothetical protein